MGLLGDGISGAIEGVGKVADDLFTSDEERLQLAIEDKKVDASVAMAQIDTNKAEASSKSLFVSGWRPFIGWTCGVSMAFNFLVHPLLKWIISIIAMIYPNMMLSQIPEPLDISIMMPVLTGMLGFGGFRMYEKIKGVASK